MDGPGRPYSDGTIARVEAWNRDVSNWIASRVGVTTVTAAHTVKADEYYIRADVSGGGFTVTLPLAKGIEGRQIIVQKVDSSANTLTLGVSGSDTINGSSTQTTTTQYSSWILESVGNNLWGIVGVGGTITGGTVTSVNASGGTTGLSFSGGPITSSGTLTMSGTLVVGNGGTGATTLTGLLQGNGTSAFTAITNSSTAGQVLRVTGASTYAWGALDLDDGDAVTGTLGVSNGGTNLSSIADASVLVTNSANTLSVLTATQELQSIRRNAGNTAWEVYTPATGTPGGSDTYVQFNDGGVFNGTSDFTFNKTTGVVSFIKQIAFPTLVAGDLAHMVYLGGVAATDLFLTGHDGQPGTGDDDQGRWLWVLARNATALKPVSGCSAILYGYFYTGGASVVRAIEIENKVKTTGVAELWFEHVQEIGGTTYANPYMRSYYNATAVTAGSFVTGFVYTILSIGTTNFTLIGAASNTVGLSFTATGAGSGTGTASLQIGAIASHDQPGSILEFKGVNNSLAYSNVARIVGAATPYWEFPNLSFYQADTLVNSTTYGKSGSYQATWAPACTGAQYFNQLAYYLDGVGFASGTKANKWGTNITGTMVVASTASTFTSSHFHMDNRFGYLANVAAASSANATFDHPYSSSTWGYQTISGGVPVDDNYTEMGGYETHLRCGVAGHLIEGGGFQVTDSTNATPSAANAVACTMTSLIAVVNKWKEDNTYRSMGVISYAPATHGKPAYYAQSAFFASGAWQWGLDMSGMTIGTATGAAHILFPNTLSITSTAKGAANFDYLAVNGAVYTNRASIPANWTARSDNATKPEYMTDGLVGCSTSANNWGVSGFAWTTGTGSQGAIALLGYAESGSAATCYGAYVEGSLRASGYIAHGIEIDVSNFKGAPTAITATSGVPASPANITLGLWVACGTASTLTYAADGGVDASLAIGIINNGGKFLRGIVIANDALTDLGSGSYIALGMGAAQKIAWDDETAWIRGTGASTDTIEIAVNSSIVGTFGTGGLATTLTTAAQGNITSIGTLTSLTTSGVITSSFSGQALLLSAAGAGAQIGAPASSGTPYIDFQSSGNSNDYDVRLMSQGGTAATNGAGAFDVFATSLRMNGGHFVLPEITAPGVAGTDKVRIYADDNGSGKTRLMCHFQSGSAIVLVTEV